MSRKVAMARRGGSAILAILLAVLIAATWVSGVEGPVAGATLLLGAATFSLGWWTRKAIDQAARFRSGDAARAVLREILSLDRELASIPQGGVAVDSVRSSFNRFNLAAESDGAGIRDPDLRSRVRTHVEFTSAVLTFAIESFANQIPPVLLEGMRQHAGMMVLALSCHMREESLPTYSPPPMANARDLIDWCKVVSGLSLGTPGATPRRGPGRTGRP